MLKHLYRLSAILIAFLFTCTANKVSAQNKYWVSFKNKTALSFNPQTFFDTKTIENRKNTGLPASDWYDLPVDASYVNTVVSLADSAGHSSRWLNAVAVYASDAQIKKIGLLPFVSGIEPMKVYAASAVVNATLSDTATDNENKLCAQISGLEGEQMAYHGLTGKGIRIAILDVGFKNADKHVAFQYLRDHNGIRLTRDFVHNKDDVYNYGAHGTSVLSCIAGKYKGYNMGLAPDAEFLLARTERETTEFIDEEDAWVAAAEWAEKYGATMISCSLGYTYQRYFYKDMNGRTSIVARGAAAAARKGMLICIAAGNEGSNGWKFISTPADADSVLTVGGYDPQTGYHIGFSSVGPTSDKRVKPNLVAAGTAWVATPKGYAYESGTSFATPLMAGFVACVWQYFHGKSNMSIMASMEAMGSLNPYFDYAHGYGIPKASYLFNKRRINDSAFTLYQDDDKIMISISTTYFKDSFTKDIKLKDKYLYAKITDPDGVIRIYNVVKVEDQKFELSSFTAYKKKGRIDEFQKANDIKKMLYYPDGWLLTVYFDDCIRTLKF